jgi:predicted metalloendopeptidase
MLRQWWDDKSSSEYDSRAKCYVKLFDSYKPRELEIHVRGNLTLGENLADAAGLKFSYRAFRTATDAARNTSKELVASNLKDAEPPPNKMLARELTNNQLFFVAYAQSYCMLAHRSALQNWMQTDPHTPGRFRVQGALSQNNDFAKAFQCRRGSTYNPEKKCSLWG